MAEEPKPKKRGRGRPAEHRLGENLAVAFALASEGATTSPADLALLLGITSERAQAILDGFAQGLSAGSSPEPIIAFYHQADGGVSRVAGGEHLRRLRLTTEQADACAEALDLLGFSQDDPTRKLFEESLFPIGYERTGEATKPMCEPEARDVLMLCARSIAGGTRSPESQNGTEVLQRPLTFTYQGKNDTMPRTRRFVPLSLRLTDGEWYVDGYDLDARAARTFRADGMREPELGKKPVQALATNTERPDCGYVELSCTPEAARQVLAWPGAVAIGETDDRTLVKVPYYRSEWLPRHVLALGSAVTHENAQLAREMRDIAKADLAAGKTKLDQWFARQDSK
jgi:hypothetical protein